jgi:hypothetical protein
MSDWVLTSSIANKANNKEQSKPKSDWVLTEPKQEEESFLQKLPRNVGIGLANLGHSTLNAPHDITQAFEGETRGFGGANAFLQIPPNIENSINRKQAPEISQYIPQQQEYDFAKMLGQEGEPTFADTLVQKGVEYSPEILGIKNFLPYMTKRGAVKTLNKAQKLALERGIGKINVDPEIVEDARQFLPNLLKQRNQINATHAGDYKSLFDLQSDVGKISAARMGKIKSLFAPESHLKGVAGLESRKKLLNALHENLNDLGHKDISDLLKKGQNEYRRYMKFKKYRNALALAGATYAAPKNALTDLIKNLWHARS